MDRIKKIFNLKKVNNETVIEFFGVIGDEFDEQDLKSISDKIKEAGDEDITIYINSIGGSVYDAIGIYNTLKSLSQNVTTINIGMAASAASIISLSGDKIHAYENSSFMIHAPYKLTIGNKHDHESSISSLEVAERTLANAYAEKMRLSIDEVIDNYFDGQEHYLTAEEAFNLGLVDKVLKSKKKVNNMKLNKKEDMTNGIQQREDIVAMVSVNEEDIIKKYKETEAKRVEDIKGMFSDTEYNELLMECVLDSNITVEKAKDMLLNKMKEGSKLVGQTYQITSCEEKRKEGIKQSILARAGMDTFDAKNEYNGIPLFDIARLYSDSKGYNRNEIVKNAITHTRSDFGTLLADVAHKSLLVGYAEAPSTFQQWTSVGSVSDFKQQHQVGLGVFPDIPKKSEGAEYKYSTVKDRGRFVFIETYGDKFSITREAIINDDLNQFTTIPRRMGQAVRRTVANKAYEALFVGKFTDGNDIFSVNNNNLASGAADLDWLAIDIANRAIGTQTFEGVPLGLEGAIILVPKKYESQMRSIVASETIVTKTNAGTGNKKPLSDSFTLAANIFQNRFTVIADQRLDLDDTQKDNWYMFTNPNLSDTFQVSYLNGVQSPFLEQMQSWNTDGAEFKVRLDFGVQALEYRSMYKGIITS